ncbi:uncharacterized protein LOC144150090 [Haemaphysalis longicornis]
MQRRLAIRAREAAYQPNASATIFKRHKENARCSTAAANPALAARVAPPCSQREKPPVFVNIPALHRRMAPPVSHMSQRSDIPLSLAQSVFLTMYDGDEPSIENQAPSRVWPQALQTAWVLPALDHGKKEKQGFY